jgi:hypothetical protein
MDHPAIIQRLFPMRQIAASGNPAAGELFRDRVVTGSAKPG